MHMCSLFINQFCIDLKWFCRFVIQPLDIYIKTICTFLILNVSQWIDYAYSHISKYFNLINIFKTSWNFTLKGPGKPWNLIHQNKYEFWLIISPWYDSGVDWTHDCSIQEAEILLLCYPTLSCISVKDYALRC